MASIIKEPFIPGMVLASNEGNGMHSISFRLISGLDEFSVIVSEDGYKLVAKISAFELFQPAHVHKLFSDWQLGPDSHAAASARAAIYEQRSTFTGDKELVICKFQKQMKTQLKTPTGDSLPGSAGMSEHQDGSQTVTVWVQEVTAVMEHSTEVKVTSARKAAYSRPGGMFGMAATYGQPFNQPSHPSFWPRFNRPQPRYQPQYQQSHAAQPYQQPQPQ